MNSILLRFFSFKGFYALLWLSLSSCSMLESVQDGDYYIAIKNTHVTQYKDKFEYGFSLENQGITDATQLRILLRFHFQNSQSQGSQDKTITYEDRIPIGKTIKITETLNASDIESHFELKDLVSINIYEIHFYNSEQSPKALHTNFYDMNEGKISF